MATPPAPIVLIVGQDSLRADRALAGVFKARGVDPADVVRIWGDEASFTDVFRSAASRSLFSDKTVVLVRRAEKLRGAGRDPEDEAGEGDDDDAPKGGAATPARGKGAGKGAAAGSDLPDLDETASLILVARKVDRRIGLWKKISKVGEVIDVDYLKGRALQMAASAEAKTLGLKIPDDLLKDLVEQSGPSLGRIVSELEKISLLQGSGGSGAHGGIAVTSSPPLYLLADALMVKEKRRSLGLLDDALRQGEPGLKVLATLHGTIRRLALFRALRSSGVPSSEAGGQLGILPFKVADTERAARSWSEADFSRAFAVFAEADRRLKLSAPVLPVLTHALARVTSGGGA